MKDACEVKQPVGEYEMVLVKGRAVVDDVLEKTCSLFDVFEKVVVSCSSEAMGVGLVS